MGLQTAVFMNSKWTQIYNKKDFTLMTEKFLQQQHFCRSDWENLRRGRRCPTLWTARTWSNYTCNKPLTIVLPPYTSAFSATNRPSYGGMISDPSNLRDVCTGSVAHWGDGEALLKWSMETSPTLHEPLGKISGSFRNAPQSPFFSWCN